MPVQRGPDGKIIEKKTELHETPDKPTDVKNQPPPAPAGHRADAGQGQWDAPTDLMDRSRGRFEAVKSEGERTVLVGGRRRRADAARREEDARADNTMEDPVVGWLVVIDGPGKGRALNLGYGVNSLGRGATDRVNLNFGDSRISQSSHATVTYDPRGRRFYLQHGSGKNLTYLNDEPVLAPTELPASSHISVGDTTLRFVPLCGESFDWQDTEANED